MKAICFDMIAESAKKKNAMIFAEANGPDGAEIVAELMKRCPERVWHGRKSFERTEDPLETAPGVRSVPNLSEDSLHAHLIVWGPDWDTDDADQAAARYLALMGRKVLCDRQATMLVGGNDGYIRFSR